MNFRLVDVTFRRGRFDGVRAERETRRNLTAALSAWLGDQSDYVKRLVKSSLIDGAVGNLRTLRILLARYFDEQTEQGLPESVTRAVKAVSDAALDTVLDDTEPEENARIDESWVAGFDERYDRKMAARLNKANLGAVVRALGELGDKDHVKATLTGLDAWPDNRAVKMAQTEIVMATNEAKVAGYRACGYESVWQSTPSCCKICQRYNNETVTALKPPLHKGCTCGVTKGARLTDKDENDTITIGEQTFPKVLRSGKQQEHIEGTAAYKNRAKQKVDKDKRAQSYFYKNVDVEALCVPELGKHEPKLTRGGGAREFFSTDKPIGVNVLEGYDGDPTTRVAIEYSSKGWHAYPTNERSDK